MEQYVAFLRGINVGGNTLLPMKELAALCTDSGLKEVRTYINSGNVLFKSTLPKEKIQIKLEKELEKKMAKPISVVVRTIQNIESIVLDDPFKNTHPSKVGVLLVSENLHKKIKEEFVNVTQEEIVVGKQEVYIHFPDGMGVSKLKWPVQLKNGTVRNINTLSKIVQLAQLGDQ
jgi:uncharacterized protein (DUF1697 family)